MLLGRLKSYSLWFCFNGNYVHISILDRINDIQQWICWRPDEDQKSFEMLKEEICLFFYTICNIQEPYTVFLILSFVKICQCGFTMQLIRYDINITLNELDKLSAVMYKSLTEFKYTKFSPIQKENTFTLSKITFKFELYWQ